MVCRILDSLSCISDSKILDFGSHMQNFPDSFTWGNQKLLKCPSCHNFLSKEGSFEMTSGFKPFTQLSLLNSKIKALVIINTVAKMMKYPVWGICHLKQSLEWIKTTNHCGLSTSSRQEVLRNTRASSRRLVKTRLPSLVWRFWVFAGTSTLK